MSSFLQVVLPYIKAKNGAREIIDTYSNTFYIYNNRLIYSIERIVSYVTHSTIYIRGIMVHVQYLGEI